MNTSGLYIHFPFCAKKCNYCDFLSFPVSDVLHQAEMKDSLQFQYTDHTPIASCDYLFSSYIKCVQNELLFRLPLLANTQITSIFFGGGTPSLMPPEVITDFMLFLNKHLNIAANAEITMECNPGTITEAKLMAMKQSGINRLSIGLQSTQNKELKYLGRIHTFEQFLDNFQLARRIGFSNINIDLMSALPGQTIASYKETLARILALEPEHISAYSLIIEEGTPFWNIYGEDSDCQHSHTENSITDISHETNSPHNSSAMPLPSEDDERTMYYLTRKQLHDHGYERYELSNYAKPGYECRHNKIYWTRGNYLGIGLGSSSLMEHCRFSNITDLRSYMTLWQTSALPPAYDHTLTHHNVNSLNTCMDRGIASFERLDTAAEMEEFMFLGLRLTDGISPDDFEASFHRTLNDVYGDVIHKHIHDKTLIFHKNRLKLTTYGQDVANYVMSDFILM